MTISDNGLAWHYTQLTLEQQLNYNGSAFNTNKLLTNFPIIGYIVQSYMQQLHSIDTVVTSLYVH